MQLATDGTAFSTLGGSLVTFGGNLSARGQERIESTDGSVTLEKSLAEDIILKKTNIKVFDKYLLTITICVALLVFSVTNLMVYILFNNYLMHPLFSLFLVFPTAFLIITAIAAKREQG